MTIGGAAAGSFTLQFGLGVVTEEIYDQRGALTWVKGASIRPRCRHRGDRRADACMGSFDGASIRPRCRHRGDLFVRELKCRHVVELQFGLGVVTEEMLQCDRGCVSEEAASIRPRCRHRGDLAGVSRLTIGSELQFGLGVVTEEIRPGVRAPVPVVRPALQFGLGVVTEEMATGRARAGASTRLQFGLGVVTEEMGGGVRPGARRPARFNSASVSSPRRWRSRGEAHGRLGRFNSASVSSPRRCDTETDQVVRWVELQFGLGVVTEEIATIPTPAAPRGGGFNSASVSSPRRSTSSTTAPGRPPCFNSASVSSPRRSEVHR